MKAARGVSCEVSTWTDRSHECPFSVGRCIRISLAPHMRLGGDLFLDRSLLVEAGKKWKLYVEKKCPNILIS